MMAHPAPMNVAATIPASSIGVFLPPALYRNVSPLFLEQSVDRDQVLRAVEDLLLEKGLAQRGDLVVLTIGEPMGKSGGTNTMKIVKVGEHRSNGSGPA